jgi:predicted enzyme related to lactoylglutathione lyase
MSARSLTRAGRFCWHEAMTTDLSSSLLFYKGLFGWETREVDMGPMGPYHVIHVGGKDIGGFAKLDPSRGAPSHWLAYITVEQLDKDVARATQMGGRILVPPTDIPQTGRFAIVADPSGAAFAPFQYSHDPEQKPEEQGPGEFCWNELLTGDTGEAGRFYAELFGWTSVIHELGESGRYTIFQRDGKDAAGMMQMPAQARTQTPPFWLPYVGTVDIDTSFSRALSLGATGFVEPSPIEGVGFFSVLGDPTGATFALFQDQA